MKIEFIESKNKKVKPDDSTLVFGTVFSDHMFTMDYDEGKGWHTPQIRPYENISISPAAMVFHYGQSIFEGMKCYKVSENEIQLFRPEKNFERLNTSCERLCIPTLDEKFMLEALIELLKIEHEWIPKSPNTSLYIRPFVFATEPLVGVRASKQYKFMILLSPVGAYYKEGLNPVKIFVEDDYVRSVRGGVGYTKAAANYAISLKGQEKAHELGYSQVLWLDGIERKYIEEVGAMNVFFKINGEIVTPELSGSILAGITRASIIELLQSLGEKVTERRVSIEELFIASENGQLQETFGTGTAAVVSPVSELFWQDKRIVCGSSGINGINGIGETSQMLYDTLTQIQYGKIEDKFGWTKKIKVN